MSKPITETLRELHRGELLEELENDLTEVVAAVRKSGKGGKLTLTIGVKPASKGDTNVLTVEAAVKTTLPKPDRSASIFYATEDNQLVREDPRQLKLELRQAAVTPMPLKEANA